MKITLNEKEMAALRQANITVCEAAGKTGPDADFTPHREENRWLIDEVTADGCGLVEFKEQAVLDALDFVDGLLSDLYIQAGKAVDEVLSGITAIAKAADLKSVVNKFLS